LAVAIPRGALAQTDRTADGVAAFVRGDYATAVELLKPAADSWHTPFDSTAAFFMALMYDNGLGVAPDPVRACALLLRASAPLPGSELDSGLTFAVQTLSQDLSLRLGPEQMAKCMLQVDIGVARDAQQSTFSLSTGHWISIDISPDRREVMARIDYAGKQRDVELFVPVQTGIRFLPFAVTEVTALRPQPSPRYFLESFIWAPAEPHQWHLIWSLFEIIRDNVVPITSADLETYEGEQPPTIDASDLRRLATVRVNGAGDAEWAVLVPSRPGARATQKRSDVIEPDAERQERAAAERERKAGEENVDWTRTRDLTRTPAFSYPGGARGCGWVYGWSADRTEAIVIGGRIEPSASAPLRFDLAAAQDVDVKVYVYPSARREFCSDVRVLGQVDIWEAWRASAGVLTIELSPVFRVREPGTYRATIRLTGGEFVGPTGTRVRQSQPITLSTIVQLAH